MSGRLELGENSFEEVETPGNEDMAEIPGTIYDAKSPDPHVDAS